MEGLLRRLSRTAAQMLLLLSVALPAAAAFGSPQPPPEHPIPFSVQDLMRRARALQKAADSLETLLEGWASGRLDDERFRSYFLERAELLGQLSKNIESDRDLRRLSDMQKSSPKADDWRKPTTPTTLDEALIMSREAAQLAAGIEEQVAGIAADANTFEVGIDELSKPDPALLCKRLRELAERLEESARGRTFQRK